MNMPQNIILPNGQFLVNPVLNQYVRLEIIYTPEMLQFFNYLFKKIRKSINNEIYQL